MAKDAAAVRLHLLELVRQYTSEEDCSPEVFCIQGFTTTTDDLFQGDDERYCKYISMYLKRYKGRAFPKEYDLFIAVKCFRSLSAGAGLKTEVAAMKAKIDKADKTALDLVDLKGKLNELKQQVQSLTRRVNNDAPPLGKGARNGGGKMGSCHYCGEQGHHERDCPKKAAEAAEKSD